MQINTSNQSGNHAKQYSAYEYWKKLFGSQVLWPFLWILNDIEVESKLVFILDQFSFIMQFPKFTCRWTNLYITVSFGYIKKTSTLEYFVIKLCVPLY